MNNNNKVYKVYEIIGEEITDWGNWYETREPACDNCGEILPENPNLKQCPHCGVTLDWSEYEV